LNYLQFSLVDVEIEIKPLSCFRDALITCVINTLTCLLAGCIVFSILGYIAFVQDAEVSDVVKSGPGLVFLTYPEVVLKLPGSVLWATIFFVMLAVSSLQHFISS
jgi:solute carrier family 6 (neurotransmitter transporter, GABA) member 1